MCKALASQYGSLNDLRRRLKTAAKRSGRRESDFVRAAVELQLAAEEKTPTAYDRMKKAGLIGIIKGDLEISPPIPNTSRVLANLE